MASPLFVRALAVSLAASALVAGSCASADDKLRQRVEQRLRAEQAPDSVDVSVDRRIVTLRGAVNSAGEQQHVEAIVRGVDGVFAVDDRLLVRQPPSLTAATPEAQEAAAISSALAAAGFLDTTVEVSAGTVHLRGKVPRAGHAEALRIVQDAAPKAKVADETSEE